MRRSRAGQLAGKGVGYRRRGRGRQGGR
jgi:hypothetical protein